MRPRGRVVAAGLCAALLAGCAPGEEGRAGDASDQLPAGEEIRTDTLRPAPGVEVVFHTMGEGPPVVVVHGGPGLDHRYLRPHLDPLAASRTVVYYDQRGVGTSSAPLDTEHVSLDAYVEDLEGLADAIAGDRGRVSVLAHSWGAWPALRFALDRPDRVAALILVAGVEPGSRYAAEQATRQAARRTPGDSAVMAALRASESLRRREPEALERAYRVAFRSVVADPASVERLDLTLAPRTARDGGEVGRLVLGTTDAPDAWDELASLEVPVLLVYGTEDAIPPAMAREMARVIPGAELQLVEGAGHFPWMEAPEAFFPALEAFLSRVAGAGGSP